MSRGNSLVGNATMLSAVSGWPPIAYTSERAFAAAICPKSNGSSTMGAKKSTVWTSARSSDRRYTPASSNVSLPTSSRGSDITGSAASARDRSPGPIFDAQPAHRANSVSLKISSRVFDVLILASLRLLRADGGYRVDLDQGAPWERRNLDGGPGRTCIAQ